MPVPVTVEPTPVNTGYTVEAVFVVATLRFVAVVAVPVTFPVRGPENAVAVTVPVDGFTVTVETVEVAAPDNVPEAGVNMIGCAVFVLAALPFIF